MRDSVLYFPHVEIENPSWLKSALLLWDHVYRIVPTQYSPHDSQEMQEAVAAGLVRPVALEDADVKGFTSDFLNFAESLPISPAGLEWDEMAWLHPEKVDAHLYPFLERYAAGESDEGFIELPREIVRGYMFFLANQVARRRNLARCTDDHYSFSVSAYFSEEGNFENVYDSEADGFYSSLVMSDMLPYEIGKVPMDKVIRAASQSKDERARLRLELMRFSSELHSCESKEHAAMVLHDYTRDLAKAKNELRRSQGFMNKDDLGSLFAVGVPTALTAYGAIVSGHGDPFGFTTIAPSMFIGAIAAYSDYKRAKSAHDNPSGAAYLISLDKQFAGTGRLPALDRPIEEFIND